MARSCVFHRCFSNDAGTFFLCLTAFRAKHLQKTYSRYGSSVSAHSEDLQFPRPEVHRPQASAGHIFPGSGTLSHAPPKAVPRCDSSSPFSLLEGWCFLARDYKAILHSMLNKQTLESVFYWFHTICHLVWGSKESCGFVGFVYMYVLLLWSLFF